MVPVILRLEDFGLQVKKDALTFVIDFIYRGEVVVPGDKLPDVCGAAHALGIKGLIDILPNTNSASKTRESSFAAAIPVVTIDDSEIINDQAVLEGTVGGQVNVGDGGTGQMHHVVVR